MARRRSGVSGYCLLSALLVAFVTRPSQAQVGINVASLAVTVTDGEVTREGSQHSFMFNAVITLGTPNGADAMGIMNRWELAVTVQGAADTCVASTSLTLTPAQAGVSIPAGGSGTIEDVVTGNLDLSGCLCSSVTELKVTLSSPAAIYTLAGMLEATAAISCRGLIGTTLTTLTAGSLVENANDQTVTLTVIGNSESQGRSIQGGISYWDAEVFLASGTVDTYTEIRTTRVAATLTSAMANLGWSSGGTLTLTDVSAMLNLDGVGSCNVIQLMCVSLLRDNSSTLLFTIEGGKITSCAPVSCVGVLINQVIPSFTMATMIKQGEQNNFGITVTIRADPTKASVAGSGLWSASAFGNADANCMNQPQVPATVTLMNNAADYGLDTAGQSVWPMISVSLNMVGAGCNDAAYLCIEVKKGDNPMPPFSLSFSPPFAKYGAVEMNCEGLTVVSGMLTVNPATQLAAFKADHSIQFDATFTSSAMSGGVSGRDLWDLMVFPAQNPGGTGSTGPASAVTLQPFQLSTPFPGTGGILPLTGLTAVLQLEADACSTYNYLCTRLSKNSAAVPDFIMSPAMLLSCSAMLSCKNVTLTSTTASPSSGASPNGLPLFEGKSNQVIYFDATLNSDVNGGSVPSGTDHWQFTVSPGATVAALTQAQKDSSLTAGTPLTFTRIMTTLDLTNQRCASLGQVCAEVMRSPDDTLGFQLESLAPQNTGCFTPTCEGVKITALVINNGVTNFALKEGAQGHQLTFSVIATVDADFGSVRGTDQLWDILVYLSMDQQQNSTVSSLASLTGWQTQDFIAGTQSTLNNVEVSLNLDSTCERMQFLCIELRKATGQTFLLDAASNVLKTCKPVSGCNGVEVTDTAVAITSGGPVVEGVASNSPAVGVSRTFAATSANITGSNFWNVTIFGSTSDAGIGDRIAQQTSVTSGDPAALATVDFDPITWNVDLTDVLCSAITHVCVEVEKSTDAPFSLVPMSATKCSPLQCEGIVIANEDFVLASNVIYEARDSQQLTATAISANAAGNGASIPDSAATNIWDVMLFLNSDANGNGTTFSSASPSNPNPINPVDRNQGVSSTNPLMFSDYTFTLSTTSLRCGAALYVCLQISESPLASKNYSITFPPSPTCKEITCKGATFVSASVVAPPTTGLIENEPAHPVVLSFSAVTAADTAVLQSGADFWILKVFASKMADGSGERYGERNAGLTPPQKSTALNADSSVDFLGVNEMLDLTGFVCPGVTGYLCAELQRDPASLPPFTIQGSVIPLVACAEVECQGVLINNIGLSGLPPAIVERGTAPVTVTATVSVGGADASGTMLWEMSASLLDGTMLLSTVPVDLGQQANTDVINGQPITFSNLTLPFDLSQLVCPSNGTITLCIDLSRAGGSNVNFTVTGATRQCTDLPCKGVVIVRSSATATSGDLKEGRESNPVVLDLSFTSSPTGASISGIGLWSLTVFGNSRENGLEPRMSEVMATLQGNDVSFPLPNGSAVEFNGVMATLDLRPYLVCEEVFWVCAELKKQDTSSVDFSLMSESNAHIACTNLNCQGVQISSTTLDLNNANSMFEEDSGSNALSLVQITLIGAPGTSSLRLFSDSYFKVLLFGSPVAGTSQTKVAETLVDTSGHQVQLTPGDQVIYSQLPATLNLTGVFCNDLNYLCVQVSRGLSPPFKFKLEGVPNDNSLIGCHPVTCKGLRVTGGTFDVTSDLLEGVEVFSLSVQVTFNTSDTGASVRPGGSNLFRLEAFVASDVTGIPDPKTPNQVVVLPSGSESQPVMAGGMIDFNGAIAMLDTTTWTCQAENFICIRLVKDPMASVNYKLEGWVDTGINTGNIDPTKLLTCQPINCQGVNITDVAIQTGGQTPSFQERDGETSFTVDVVITAAAGAGSVVGTGLWNVTFALNSQADGNGSTFETLSVAALSEENSDKSVAVGSNSTLSGVTVTMPAVADILCSVADPFYLCVKVEKASGSSPDFTIMTIDWQCVPVTCYPVIISDIQFEVTLPTYILENVDNDLHVDLHISTDLNSADIAGTGLWNSPSFQIRDSANAVTPLNAAGNYWTSSRENTALIANQTVDFVNIFPVQITPAGMLCENLDELCLTFEKGDNPVPQFDLNFTTPNDVCIPITCKGVEIVSTVISNIEEGSSVKERSTTNLVVLSTLSVSAGDAASIVGTNLWDVSFYYTPHANGAEDPTIGKDMFPLNPVNLNARLDAGQNLALINLGNNIDLSNLVCPASGLWLCARLQRHTNPSPLFTLSAKNGDDSVFIGCESVTCRGVEVEDTSVFITSGGLIPVENAPSHTFNFLYQAMYSPGGASIMGTGLWQLKVFANRRQDGSHHRKAYEAMVALSADQTNAPLSNTDRTLLFTPLTVTLNLQNTDCRQTPYFCAQLQKGASPSPEFSLQGSPDDSALITCNSLDCNGVKIDVFSLTGTGGNILHENEGNQMFSFNVALTSNARKDPISGENLWEFKAYLNNHEDCLGDAEEVALTNAVIQPGEEDQDLVNGGTINFKVDVPLDYQMECPSWPKVYLCLEVHVGPQTSTDFTLFGEIVKGDEIQCKGVEVTNTAISEVNSGRQIVESDAEVTFDLNLRISSNADGSSISGLGLWSVDIFTSDMESCATVTSQRVTSSLSVSNLNKPLSAGAVFLMNNVRATVPLPDALCENINYVCAEWGKGPGASPNFTLVPIPDEMALIASSAIECKGLHIQSTQLNLFMGEPLISNDPRHPISFDFAIQTDPNGASVIDPVNLFRLQVAATAVPSRDGVVASQHFVNLPYSPLSGIDINAGQLYSIPVEAELNLMGARCVDVPYVCVTLTKGLNAEPRFTLTPDISDPVLTACTQRLDCRGVRIVSEQLTINSGIPFVEHATNNPVDLTVTLTSDAAGGSATGVNLWSAEVKLSNEDPLAQGTVFRANTSGILTGNDADKDLLKGDTIELNIMADLNLDGLSCSDVRYLIVVITNPNAVPGFTLEWRNSSSVVVTQLFTCTGVSLSPNSLIFNSVSPLLELAANSTVMFSVSVLASPTSATVRGMDLWKATVFLSADQNGAGTRQAETEAVLDSTNGAIPIVAGQVSGLDAVTVTLTTANLYCRDMAYLCVEVWRGSAAQPFYNIEAPATQSGLRQCRATECNGVQVMSVESTIITNYPLIEQRPNQQVRLELNVTASPTSAGINGDNLWRATVFVTPQADGSGTRGSEREATISASQSGRDLNPAAVLTLENLIATMDFTGIPCSQMRYICVTLGEGAGAQPDFSLTGLPDDNSLTNCVETNCISVAIQSGSLNLGSNEVLESDNSATFMVDASFTPWSNSQSLQADSSWDLYVFASNCSDGCGVESARVKAALTTAQQNQGVMVGTALTFDGLVATLDLTGINCADTTHLCVRLATQDGVPFVLGGYPTEASLVGCVELQCFTNTVDLYATEVTDRRISVAFSEAYGDFDLYVLSYSPPDGITNSPFSIPRNLRRALDFNQLVPGQLYTIELTLMDGADIKAGPFVLEERTIPDAVTLQLDSITSSELTVTWDAASGMFDYYTITLDPSDNGLPHTPFNVYPNQNRELTFTGLLTARSYNVTIVTVSGLVPSLPSTVVANTEPSRPILISTGRAETTIDLRWFIDRTYIVDHYEVTYDPVGTSTQPLSLPSEVDSTTLVDLVPGRFYVISLVAVSNLAGNQELRSTPSTVSIRTRPVAPADITHTPTETSIQVEWPSSVGELDFYTVTFSPSVNLGETKVLKDSPRELLFQGLEVASEYTVTITTHIENVDENLASVPIQRIFYTLPHTPGPLSIVKVTTTSIEFQWQDAAGPRDGYEVIYVPNEPEFDPQSPFFTTSNSMLLSGIQPHVTVDFEVRTKIGNVVSRPRKLRQRTFPTQPGPVRDFEVISFDSDQIRISFKAPESPNGLILAYLVSVQGTKPGEPNDSAFQTITALPNDIQFDEIISPLKAGYTYILSIQATNTEGSSDPVYLDPITLPIKAPFFSGQQISFADFVLEVTSSTITINIPKSLFSDKNGVVTAYTVVIVQEGANQTAVAILPSYQQIRGRAVWPVYQTSEPFNPFNTARRRRQTVNGDTVDFVIGQEETCPGFGYCNGNLKPITQFRVRVRAYTENGQFTDSPWSDVITTKFDPWWFVYALIPFMIIVLIIAFIMCLCSCVAGDKKKKPAKRPQRREKADEAFQSQANENANNIYGTTSSQERLTPDTPPPKRGPTSRPVEVAKFGQHVRKLSSKLGDNFGKEYEDLNFIGESHAKTVGNLTQNVDKNRYPNIVPYDYNRISLDKDEDYINASILTGFNGANEYIASQGPKDNTVNDFWQMIWEQNTPAIAVIGSPVENGRVKFVQYWPSDSTPITFGNITVNKVSEREETKHGYIVRDFCLESGSEVRALRQFNFITWPEHGVPKSSNQMLNFVRAVRSALPHNAGALLVHCGAGIGRTGVFIALDILTQHLSLDEKYIDVFGTVAKEREERTNMVQTVHQYEFLHRALLDILEGRVSGPNWVLKSKRRTSVDSDQMAADEIGEASL